MHRAAVAGLGGLVVIAVALTGAYAASPLVAAWSIREAVKAGDADYLRHRIDWPRIKETLKSSMGSYALGIPGPTAVSDTDAAEAPGELPGGTPTAQPQPQPGLWQRIKTAYGRRVVDGLVESYVTPEGLPKLFKYRRSYHQTIGSGHALDENASLLARIRHEWSRLRQARFLSPTRFAIEIDDRFETGRRIAGVLELGGSGLGLGWRLVSLEVKGEASEGALTRLFRINRQASLE